MPKSEDKEQLETTDTPEISGDSKRSHASSEKTGSDDHSAITDGSRTGERQSEFRQG